MMTKEEKSSSFYVFISAVLFSIGGLCIKSIPWNSLAINGARSIISVIIILIYLIIIKHKIKINRYILLGALCIFVTNTLYVLANKMTTAANAIILQFTAPIFIIFFMWIFFKQKPKKAEIVTCTFVFGGIILFFVDSISVGGAIGNLFAIFSGASYAVVFMLNTLPKADAISSIIIGHGLNFIVGFPFILKESDFSTNTLIWITILGVFQVGIAYIFLSKGLKHTPAVAASLISGIEPVLNPLIVAIFANELISPIAFCGAAIVLISIITYNIKKSKQNI